MFRKLLAASSRCIAGMIAAGFMFLQPVTGPTRAFAQPLTQQQVADFLANPSSIVAANPNGGSTLVSLVRDLVLTNADTLQAVILLAQNLNTQLATANDATKAAIQAQLSAIGSGLGQAALALVQSNPDLANQIQTALAASGLETVIAAYSATTGNVVTAAGGDGGGSGGGGIGGPIGSTLPTGGGGGGSGAGGTTGGGAPGGGGGLTGGAGVGGGSGTGNNNVVTTSTSPS